MDTITITTQNETFAINMIAENWRAAHEAALMGLGEAMADSRHGHTHLAYDPEAGYHFVHIETR